jgi:hypothetical protein
LLRVKRFLGYNFCIVRINLTIVAVFVGLTFAAYAHVPRDGSKPGNQSDASKNQSQSSTISQVHFAPAEEQKDENPKPYQWRELYAPANIPNWALAILAGWAGIMALKTLRAINKQADKMEGQLTEMRRATEATLRQATISERALIAQFRPKVIVRSLRLDPSSFVYFDRRNDGEWRILMQLANIGGTKATIFRGTGYFQEYWGPTPRRDLSPWWILQGPIVIEPGQRETIEYSLDAETFREFMRALEASTQLRRKPLDRAPIFHGSFAYRDESEVERETGFGRSWSVSEERFIPLDNPDFEYQD